MKKTLLFAALAAACFSMNAQEASLTLNWKNTNPPAAAEARQVVVKDGLFYFQVKGDAQVQVYGEEGPTGTTYESQVITGITKDQAGNIIVRSDAGWPTGTVSQLKVIPADGSEMVTIDLEGVTPGRNDFLGLVKGNILEGEATMYLMPTASTSICVINFVDGEQDTDNTYEAMIDAQVSANGQAYVSYVEGAKGEYLLLNHRQASIYNLVADGDNFLCTALVTPDRIFTGGKGVNNGISGFTLNGEDFVIYNTGDGQTNYTDAWSIAKISSDEANAPVVACTEGLANLPAAGGYQTTWLFAEPGEKANEAYIYVYHPGYYYACYTFTYGEDEPAVIVPESITLNYEDGESVQANPGDEIQLRVLGVTPAGADASVVWSSGNEMVATVSEAGLVNIAEELPDEAWEEAAPARAQKTLNFRVPVTATSAVNPDVAATVYFLVTYTKDATGVTSLTSVKAISSVKYVNVAGQVSDVPFSGVNMMVTEFVDGTQSVVKIVK